MPNPLRRAHTAAVVLMAVAGALSAPVAVHAATMPRLIVGFTSDATPAQQGAGLRSSGVTRSRSLTATKGGSIDALDAVVVPVASGDLDAVRRRLLARADVRYVEVDGVVHASDLGAEAEAGFAPGWKPNDTLRSQQWALDTMHAEKAWEFSRGTGITIAVVDTGVDYIHPDLAGRVDKGPDLVDGDDDPMDVNGHGTHVSGIAAGTGDDNFGIVGLAPNARILAVRVLDAKGAGNYSTVAKGIVAAADAHARVINLSLGGPEESPVLHAAIDYAAARGAVVTCASGNESASAVAYPGTYDSCLSVGATDLLDGHADFSNTGAGLDVAAPGVGILSSVMGGGHDSWDGTSMATPYASGLAALLAAQGLGRRDIIAAMEGNATDLGSHGLDKEFGYGRLDAGAAVEAASRMPRAAADTVAPSVAKVEVLAAHRVTTTTYTTGWRVAGRTPFRRYGTTPEVGRFTWKESRLTATKRVVSTFRTSNRIVYRATVTYVKGRTPHRHTTVSIPVRVTASDDVAVDRVAIEVDGRTRAVDWSDAGGWVVQVPCAKGSHTVSASAFDTADNRGSGTVTAQLAC
ncbi:MAG: peptidase [Thermoleophilia bacterium]|nr:peptidase [Thermoleophilia bacterium]